jgi:cadmium resistance protein CadD (predicted permease)
MFEHLLRHFLRTVYFDGRSFVYGVMSFGAMAVTMLVVASDAPVYVTLQRSLPWIYLTVLPLVLLMLVLSKKTMDRPEILKILENKEKNCMPIIRKFGMHIVGFTILLICGGGSSLGQFCC